MKKFLAAAAVAAAVLAPTQALAMGDGPVSIPSLSAFGGDNGNGQGDPHQGDKGAKNKACQAKAGYFLDIPIEPVGGVCVLQKL